MPGINYNTKDYIWCAFGVGDMGMINQNLLISQHCRAYSFRTNWPLQSIALPAASESMDMSTQLESPAPTSATSQPLSLSEWNLVQPKRNC